MVKNSIKAGYQTVEYLGKEIQIPENWEKTEQENVCEFINGYAFSESEFTNSGYLIIRIQNLMGGKNFVYSNVKLPEKQFAIKGDLLFTWSATFSPFIWDGEKSAFHYHQWKVIPKPLNDKMFLYYHLERVAGIIKQMGQSGLGMFHMTKAGMEKFPILKPKELHEQEQIAKILTDINKLIEKLQNLILKKKNIQDGVLQELLTGKKRLEGFNGKWIYRKLEEITKDIRDGTHQTPTYVKNGIPFYSVENITDDNFTDTKYISKKEHQTLTKSFRIEKGDILMTRIGSIGDCKLIDWDVDASFYVSLAILKLCDDISPEYIYQYSKSDLFKKELEIRSLLWAVPKKINLENISDIPIYIPVCKEEQLAIANILSDMDSEIKELETQRDKYIRIKNGIIQKLLTGEIQLT